MPEARGDCKRNAGFSSVGRYGPDDSPLETRPCSPPALWSAAMHCRFSADSSMPKKAATNCRTPKAERSRQFHRRLQTRVELLPEYVGQVTDLLENRLLRHRHEVLALHGGCVRQAAGGSLWTRWVDQQLRRLPSHQAGVPCDHRQDRVFDLLVEAVALHHYRGPDFGPGAADIRELRDDDITAIGHGLSPYRRWYSSR